MFVITYNDEHDSKNSYKIVELKIDNSAKTFTKLRTYSASYNGSPFEATGMYIKHNSTTNKVTFYLKTKTHLVKSAEMSDNLAGVTTINFTNLFTINPATSKFVTESFAGGNYTWLKNSADYSGQGFAIRGGKIFTAFSCLTHTNRSVVLVFTESNGKIDNDLTFRVNSSAYKNFEYEDVGFDGDGKIYVNANVMDQDGMTQEDGIFTFPDYIFE